MIATLIALHQTFLNWLAAVALCLRLGMFHSLEALISLGLVLTMPGPA